MFEDTEEDEIESDDDCTTAPAEEALGPVAAAEVVEAAKPPAKKRMRGITGVAKEGAQYVDTASRLDQSPGLPAAAVSVATSTVPIGVSAFPKAHAVPIPSGVAAMLDLGTLPSGAPSTCASGAVSVKPSDTVAAGVSAASVASGAGSVKPSDTAAAGVAAASVSPGGNGSEAATTTGPSGAADNSASPKRKLLLSRSKASKTRRQRGAGGAAAATTSPATPGVDGAAEKENEQPGSPIDAAAVAAAATTPPQEGVEATAPIISDAARAAAALDVLQAGAAPGESRLGIEFVAIQLPVACSVACAFQLGSVDIHALRKVA